MSTPPLPVPAPAALSSDGHTNQFQFTEEEEVKLLKCYLKIARSAENSQPSLDSPALDRIERALGPKFSQIHIADKLHRLKLLYHKFARTKSFVKTPHHRRILDIGRRIWGKSPTPTTRTKPHKVILRTTRKNSETPSQLSFSVAKKEVGVGAGADLNKFPLLVGEFSRLFPGNVVWREVMRGLEEKILMGMNQNWVLLHIEEAELNARRAALLHHQLRSTLTDTEDQ